MRTKPQDFVRSQERAQNDASRRIALLTDSVSRWHAVLGTRTKSLQRTIFPFLLTIKVFLLDGVVLLMLRERLCYFLVLIFNIVSVLFDTNLYEVASSLSALQ